MYFFYVDESGSRDPSIGTLEKPKDHLYVLLAVGMWEGQWKYFEREISSMKLKLASLLPRTGKNNFISLADCEVKSNWLRNKKEREKKSPFLHTLSEKNRQLLTDTFFKQVTARKVTIITAVIDKRHLHGYTTPETLHKKAYEFLLERIEHYMAENHPKHNALIIMDDSNKELNQAIAMKHAYFQRSGNQNMRFSHIVEYPFFTRSELSSGIQLADLLAYNVYRAFRAEDFNYPYYRKIVFPNLYRRKTGSTLDGLKIWPEKSMLINKARLFRQEYKKENLPEEVF